MAIHNEGYVFERDAPPDARAAFSSPPKKTLFHLGVWVSNYGVLSPPKTEEGKKKELLHMS